MQYLTPSTDLPATSAWDPSLAISADGANMMALGSRPRAGEFLAATRVAIKHGSGAWQDTELSPSTIPAPAGYPDPVNGLGATSIALGPKGDVIVGVDTFWSGSQSATSESAAWFSTDGTGWTLTDLRNVAGAGNSFRATTVTATPNGFVAAGTLTNPGATRVSTLAVLTSPDGLAWTLAATIKGPWALGNPGLITWGSKLLLRGMEYPCDANGFSTITFGLGGQERLWSSADGGASWTSVDMSAAGVVPAKTFPTSAAQCPKTGDPNYLATIETNFDTDVRFLDVQGDKVFLEGARGTKIATSSDLSHWVVAELPGAVPAVGGGVSSQTPSRAMTADGNDLVLLSLEAARDTADQVTGLGSQVLAWRSTDAGSSWTRIGPAARPIITGDDSVLYQLPDSSVLLSTAEQAGTGDPALAYGRALIWHSIAGPLAPWGGDCSPAPGADCSFSRVTGIKAGTDLHGINLAGASVSSSDLSGANLSGADLRYSFFNAPLTGANMSRADASKANLQVDLTGADLTNADLAGAASGPSVFQTSHQGVDLYSLRVSLPKGNKTLAGHDFGDDNLSVVYFTGTVDGPADLSGADFSKATLLRTSFYQVNLTGAKFVVPATIGGNPITQNSGWAEFDASVTCPDGKSASVGAGSYLACRLSP